MSLRKTIPQLTDATTVNASDELIIQQSGITKRATVAELLQGAINVKHYGAKGDGVTDDTAAIQAAINANAGKAIYFPSGIYKFSQQLRVAKKDTCLIGDARHASQLWYFANTSEPAILVKSDTSNPDMGGIVIADIGLNKLTGVTLNSIGIEFDRCGVVMRDCYISGFPSALILSGCRNCFFSNISSTGTNAISNQTILGASAVTVRKSNTDAGLTGFTIVFENCLIGGGTAGHAVYLASNDYCAFSNCYISGGNISIVKIEGVGDYVYDNWFDHCYFDGVFPYGSNPAPLGVLIGENTAPSAIHHFTDCAFGQMDAAIFIDEEDASQIGIVGCRFRYCYEKGIIISSDKADVRIAACAFDNSITELSSQAMIQIDDAKAVTITGNVFNFNAGSYPANTRGIRLSSSATADAISIVGNAFISSSANVTDFSDGGATVSSLTLSANASTNATNTVIGSVVGNTASSNTKALDWYEEGTWTPELRFGGATTGITYSSRTGSYTRIGNRVLFDCYFLLTSKGSASGSATVDGLPFNQSDNAANTYTVSCGVMDAGVGDANLDATRSSNTGIALRKQGSGVVSTMTETDFANNTFVHITGTYRV